MFALKNLKALKYKSLIKYSTHEKSLFSEKDEKDGKDIIVKLHHLTNLTEYIVNSKKIEEKQNKNLSIFLVSWVIGVALGHMYFWREDIKDKFIRWYK